MNQVHDENYYCVETQIRYSRNENENTEPLLMTSVIRSSKTVPIQEFHSSDEEYKDDSLPMKQQENNWSNIKLTLLGPQIQTCRRRVHLDGRVNPQNLQNNMMKNSKYNIVTFLPLVLYEQFHQFINIFYLGLTISQLIDILKVGFLIDYLGPLSLVVTLSLLKELYDDFYRHQRDRSINSYQYVRITADGIQFVRAGNLKVGMIIEVNANERIPADIILLRTQDPQGQVFIRTDQLDGETDWKLRKSINCIQNTQMNITNIIGYAKCNQPIEDIYQFKGVYTQINQNGEKIRESLSLENTLWANTVLANDKILGLIIQVGKETRMSMNSKVAKTKFGLLDLEINKMSIYLFIMTFCLSLIVVLFSPIKFLSKDMIVAVVRYLILLSNIIPISMRVNLEFAKLIYSYNINKDSTIEGTIARNSNIPESLGRIQYLLCDKTGTLTQNDMIFKKLSLETYCYTNEDRQELCQILQSQVSQSIYPAQDVQEYVQKKQNQKSQKIQQKNKFKRDKDKVLRDLLTALALCHNVTPVENENGERTFQASSPDEIALVKIAESVGIRLIKRDQNYIVIQYDGYPIQTYEILNNFPFSSDTKRMGIILYNKVQNLYLFYLKGADTVMKKFVQETQRGFIDEECENLAREGLRTLVITQKVIHPSIYNQWIKKYEQANQSIDNRESQVSKVVAYLEKDMEFLGISGVEDKLQEDVCQTLENFLIAGINVWMLTGDKIETAICIAISSGIKKPDQTVFLLREIHDEVRLQMLLNQYETYSKSHILVIDGVSLATALQSLQQQFFQIAAKSQSVICCRCSPKQKAQVTECIKKYTQKTTACVGDGGNDVGMIQQADLGIGIEGKEGKQAALASDFSIQKFKYLNQLLLWHGRLSYKRSAVLSQFVIHRGLIISIIQACFMFTFYFLSISIFSGYLMLGYATVFTMFPVFSIIFDKDVDPEVAHQYPQLYQTLQKGRDLNSKTFIIWVWKATYQGVVIMVLSLILFKNIFLTMETVAFTTLIFTEYLMIYSELHSVHWVMVLTSLLSAGLYFICIYFFPGQLLVSEMSAKFFIFVIVEILVSWVPLFVFKLVFQTLQPTDYQKIMRSVKQNRMYNGLMK